MKKHNLLKFTLLTGATLALSSVLIISCNDEKKSFEIDLTDVKEQYKADETVSLVIANPKNDAIDSVAYTANGKRIGSVKGNAKFEFNLQGSKFGYQEIKAMVYTDGDSSEATARIEVVSSVKTQLVNFEVVNTYPHDTESYTQGLEFYRDTLFEGTGQYGKSTLRKNNYKTGEAYKRISLDGKYFGEGVTIFNNKVYQLTWKEGTGFIYNPDNLQKEKDFAYFKDVQGWGLTHDDKYLYMSDGSEKIYKLDPVTLKEVDYINVYTGGTKVKSVNELEWIDGKIYGNIYQENAIAIIDPATGAVEGVMNMTSLSDQVKNPSRDVLNGIAYNPKTKTIFITGKNWDKMFEVKIKNSFQ
ncbi:glutamine cyclotransferase [Flavobacterium album]|uniref:Glutamine cyclotransferase n=1 Tax=Flavobacterium album TaxID=2175091 RepID=A0A2S1R0M0_9FLAO|nr:glutaminyl-peptide cyclotransferase [Flavobacterium album]AWH86212.1 glutamine cyclotransferase [Flavobacterium album]